MELGVPIGIAPAQVGGEGFAHQIVWKQTSCAGFHERQRAQPVKQLVGVRHAEQFSEQGLGHQPHERTRFQSGTMGWARDVLDKLREERGDDIWRHERLERDAVALCHHIRDK